MSVRTAGYSALLKISIRIVARQQFIRREEDKDNIFLLYRTIKNVIKDDSSIGAAERAESIRYPNGAFSRLKLIEKSKTFIIARGRFLKFISVGILTYAGMK